MSKAPLLRIANRTIRQYLDFNDIFLDGHRILKIPRPVQKLVQPVNRVFDNDPFRFQLSIVNNRIVVVAPFNGHWPVTNSGDEYRDCSSGQATQV